MRDIYTQASKVLIWLGEADSLALTTFYTLQMIYPAVRVIGALRNLMIRMGMELPLGKDIDTEGRWVCRQRRGRSSQGC